MELSAVYICSSLCACVRECMWGWWVSVTSLNYWNPLKIQLIQRDKFYRTENSFYNILESQTKLHSHTQTAKCFFWYLEFNYSTCSPIYEFYVFHFYRHFTIFGNVTFNTKSKFSREFNQFFALSFSVSLARSVFSLLNLNVIHNSLL